MKILLVSSYLPYPLYSGGHIRLYNLLKILSLKHEITLVCEKRVYQTKNDEDQVKKICSELIVVNRKKQWSLQNVLTVGFSSYPFLLIGHKNVEMEKKIKKLLITEHFDLIHAETFYIMHNIPSANLPIVLVEHNIEYLVYERFVNRLPFPLNKVLKIDIYKMKKWEKYYWEKVDKLIAVSPDEKNVMLRHDVEVVPNGVDVHTFSILDSEDSFSRKNKKILFIGDFKWIQNKDSLDWILKEIWPLVRNVIKDTCNLWIVGKNIPKSFKEKYKTSDIIFDENASDNTNEIYKQSFLLLAPIRVGGGTRYKILESMASGLPVVTTTLGIEGLMAEKNKDILVANTKEEIIEEMKKLLHDKILYKNISLEGRKTIEAYYDWVKITSKLEEIYKSVLQK